MATPSGYSTRGEEKQNDSQCDFEQRSTTGCYLLPSVTIIILKMNETDLLREFRENRSEEAFSQLVRRYAGLVYSVAKRRVFNAALAEDIAQIVFIRFAKMPPKVEDNAGLVAWLHRATVNASIDLWRSESRRRAREIQAAVMETSNSETVVWEEISPKVDEALNHLSEADRQTILLRFFGQKSMREVGAALGIGEDAAKMRVSRAVDRLRAELGGGGVLTATLLAGLLLERSVEAAPGQLVARLSAIKLPAAVGAAGVAGVIGAILARSKLELAGVAAGLAVVGFVVVHHFWPVGTRTSPATTASVDARTGSNQTERAGVDRFDARVRAAIAGGPSGPASNNVKMLFHVLDAATGGPLAGAQVHVAFFGVGGHGESHDYVSDQSGVVSVSPPDDPEKGLTPNVFAVAEGHVSKAVNFSSRGSVMPADYTMKLPPAMTVGGYVVNDQGQPVSGVKILIRTPGNTVGESENIDFQTCPVTNRDDGSWTCSYVPLNYTNSIPLILKKAGYALTSIEVPVTKVDLRQLVLVLDRGFVVTGRISDTNGEAIPGARLRKANGYGERELSAAADTNGVFKLEGLASDVGYAPETRLETNAIGNVLIHAVPGFGPTNVELAIQADGYCPLVKTIDLSNATNVADFTLLPGSDFRGRVIDETGRSIPNAVVQTDWNNQGLRDFEWTTRTDAQGRFEWKSAPPTPTLFWIEAEGYEVQRDVEFVANGRDHEITLVRANPKK